MQPKLGFSQQPLSSQDHRPSFPSELLAHQQLSPDCLLSLLEARGGWSLLGDTSGCLHVLPVREPLQVS